MLRHKPQLIVVIIFVLIISAAAYGVTHVTISALPEPGLFETSIATRQKDWYISRGAHSSAPAAPKNIAPSVSAGETLFGMGAQQSWTGRAQAGAYW
jgi:hypothetical protein